MSIKMMSMKFGLKTKVVNIVSEAILVWWGKWNISVSTNTGISFQIYRYIYIIEHNWENFILSYTNIVKSHLKHINIKHFSQKKKKT